MTQNKDTEKWREDFPFDAESDNYIIRRDFLRFLTVVSGGLAFGTGAIMAKSITEKNSSLAVSPVDICDENTLQPGSWLVFHFPDEKNPAILIRKENGDYLAYTQKCPHLACPVTYHRSSSEGPEHIGCHCHRGKFDLASGEGVAGPPRELRPLKAIDIKIQNNRIWASGYKGVV